jgi:hypothetical protein
MTINFLAIILVTIASFMGGALWFGPIFGKAWMKIHHAHALSKEETQKAMKGSWKLMLGEFILTFVINFFLYFIVSQSSMLMFALGTAFYIWLGFVLPTTVSSVLWGNDDRKVMFKKVAISSIYRLLVLLAAAYVFFTWN